MSAVLNSQFYEVCKGGPVVVYYTPGGKEPSTDKFAFQIEHGWQPLCFSTAYCFSRIICQSEVPVVIPSGVEVVVLGSNVHIFATQDCTTRQEAGSRLDEESRGVCELPKTNVVDIYGARLHKFGEKIEAWVTDGMTVYCPGKQSITCLDGSQTTLTRCSMEARDYPTASP